MTTLIAEVGVLKTDTKNRVRIPAERREALLDEFERSSMSGAQFAELTGIKYQTFANWAQKRRRKRAAADGSAVDAGTGGVQWVEAVSGRQGASVMSAVAAKGHLRVQLPGGASLELSHRSQLMMAAELLRTLVASASL